MAWGLMRLASFLTELFEQGHVHLDAEPAAEDDDDRRDAGGGHKLYPEMKEYVAVFRIAVADWPE
jgi:hypothetical protein